MAARPNLKAGVALASAAVIAVLPAISSPLTPQDMKVAKDTAVRLAANDYVSIVNTFFGKPPGSTDAPGLHGFPGVVHQYAKEIAGPVQANQDLVDGFFTSGISEVVRQYMIASAPTLAQQDVINGFFAGGLTDLVHRQVLASTSDPTLVPFINAFFDQFNGNPALKGVPGVIFLRLMASDLTPEQKSVVNDLFLGGMTQVVWNQLLARTSDPQQVQTINDFFTGGATQVVRTQLLSRTTDPNQIQDIAAFFPDAYTGYGGGISENVRLRLLGATTDPVQQDLINGFFDEGISEVVRYLLVGPAPMEFSAFSARAAAPEEAALEALAAPEAPAAPAEPAAAGVAAPAAAPAAPKFTAKVRDTSVAEEEAEGADDGGANKFAPEIIVGANGPNAGSGSWGVFGQVADAVATTVAGALKPAVGEGGSGSTDSED